MLFLRKIRFFFFVLTIAVANDCPVEMITLDQLFAGQPFVSEATIDDVIRNPYGSVIGYEKGDDNMIRYKYNNGTSPFSKPLQAIALPSTFARPYALVDAHHRVRAALKHIQELGGDIRSLKIPITIDPHLKDLPEATFWQQAINKGLIYTGIDEYGTPNKSLDLMDIMDVPNDDMRHFLEKVSVTFSASKAPIYGSPNHNLALWVRINESFPSPSVPFIEFYIADVLRMNAFTYKVGDIITEELVEKARKILIQSEVAEKAKTLIRKDGTLVNIVTGLTPEAEYIKNLSALPRAS